MPASTETRVSLFVNIGEAAEMLLVAGYAVKLDYCGQQRCIDVNDSVTVVVGYRDGTNWKFKRETIQEFIDDHEGVKV